MNLLQIPSTTPKLIKFLIYECFHKWHIIVHDQNPWSTAKTLWSFALPKWCIEICDFKPDDQSITTTFLCIYFNRNSWVVENNWLFFSVWFTTIASHPLLKSLNVCLLNVTWVGHKTHNIWFSVDRVVIKWQPKV